MTNKILLPVALGVFLTAAPAHAGLFKLDSQSITLLGINVLGQTTESEDSSTPTDLSSEPTLESEPTGETQESSLLTLNSNTIGLNLLGLAEITLSSDETSTSEPTLERVVSVPEPATVGLFGLGAFALAAFRRRRRQNA